jgi:hypothetical protein
MTGLAQRAKVALGMSAAFGERSFVMDFIGSHIKSTFKAILTERILGNVQVTDFTPTMVVVLGVAVNTVVCAIDNSLVQGAVAFTTDVFNTTTVSTAFKRLEGDIFIHELILSDTLYIVKHHKIKLTM